MSTTSRNHRPNRTHLRLINARATLADQPQPGSQDYAFGARELVLATLPHSHPRGNPPEWTRRNGDLTLSIRPGWKTDPGTGDRVCLGYPYGVIPRLILFWLTTEALRTRSRRIALSESLNGFLRELALDPATGGGKRGDAQRLREQMERLFRATISFDYTTLLRTAYLDMQIAPRAELWWDPCRPEQGAIFGSWIELGAQFYEAITAHPVPLDLRAIRALKSSPLALDTYAWIVYRHYAVCTNHRPARVPWRELRKQIGSGYSTVKDFKKRAMKALNRVLALYPTLDIRQVNGGIEIHPGRPLIEPRAS